MSILIAAAAALLVQPAQAPAAPQAGHGAHAAPAAPATAQRFSVNSTRIADLLANPAAKAVLDRHLPGFSAHPMIGQAAPLTLKAVQGFAQGAITDAHLRAIETDLATLPAS
jgi:para-nitrobenzyl esterase